MTWTPHLTHSWRDLSVIFGQDFETNSFSERDLNHARRAMSFLFGHIYEATCLSDRDSIETWRDMSFIFGQIYEATPCSYRDLIHACRDMSVTKPPHETAVHHRSRLIFEKLTFIKNWKNGKVILDFELEKCTRDIFTLLRAVTEKSRQCLNELDWIWLCGETCLEVCC